MNTTGRTARGSFTRQRDRVARFVAACASALAACALLAAAASAGAAPQTAPGDVIDPRTYAPKSKLFVIAHATGVQKYTCEANGTWLFTDPEATLYKTTGRPKAEGTHFLNFATGRPVWQWKDGSSVETARKATLPVGAADIPWLLLQTTATTASSDGDRLTATTWVQRLNTSGGVAPAGTCTPGDRTAVAYSADYFFWRAKGKDESTG